MPDDDEHCVIYAMFPQQLEALWNKKNEPVANKCSVNNVKPTATNSSLAIGETKHYNISVNGKNIAVSVETVH